MIDVFICFYFAVRVWWICANMEQTINEHDPRFHIGILFICVSVAKFWNWDYRKLMESFYYKSVSKK